MTHEHPDEFDSPWKEALEQALPEFLALFFPEAYAGIDWRRGYRFRDEELQQVVRDAELGRRYADKLAEVAGEGWGGGSAPGPALTLGPHPRPLSRKRERGAMRDFHAKRTFFAPKMRLEALRW